MQGEGRGGEEENEKEDDDDDDNDRVKVSLCNVICITSARECAARISTLYTSDADEGDGGGWKNE